MIAVILIGGMGTRLRPLTCDTPKPILPLVNRPFLEYQFELLKSHGIRDVVLCTSYRPQSFKKALQNGRRLGMRLKYVHEIHPLGTGGALKNAQPHISDTAIVLNGDVLNTLDITKFLSSHRKNRASVSIALTRVKDPTLYGLVETEGDGQIKRFLEKPSWDEIQTNTINAGAYLFEPAVLDRIPAGINYSLERGLFPQMLQNNERLFGYVTSGYWIDIGTVGKYLQVHHDILRGLTPFKAGRRVQKHPDGAKVVLGAKTSVADFVRFSGAVCVGPGSVIGKGASLEDCVVLEGVRIGEGASLKGCIIGARCRIGAQAVLSNGTALGAGSKVEPYSLL